MVVLNEARRVLDAFRKHTLVVGFDEEPTRILEEPRLENLDIRMPGGDDPHGRGAQVVQVAVGSGSAIKRSR